MLGATADGCPQEKVVLGGPADEPAGSMVAPMLAAAPLLITPAPADGRAQEEVAFVGTEVEAAAVAPMLAAVPLLTPSPVDGRSQ